MNAPLHLGVVAPVLPGGGEATVTAAALQRELEHRLGPATIDFRTTSASSRPLDPNRWRQLRDADFRRLAHAVIVDTRVEDDPAVRAAVDGVDIVISTDLFAQPTGLARVLVRRLDDAELETRRRMLVHLGLLPEAPATLTVVPTSMPLTATDLYLVAQQLVDTDDDVLAALGGADAPDVVADIDDLIDRLRGLLPDSLRETDAQLHERLAATERRLADERARHAVEIRSLSDRLQHVEDLLDVATRRRHPDESGADTSPSPSVATVTP